MRSLLIKNSRKAQMEMTMGTLVTIVLLTMALILGGYFVRQIFSGATTSIEGIDQAMFVRFDVPETTPPCNIRYQIQLYHEGKTPYSPPVDVDVEIKSD